MNERIKLLAEQATIKTSYQYQTWGDRIATGHKEQFDKEKFAELIVQECMFRCNINQAGNTPLSKDFNEGHIMGVYECFHKIRNHFGVEDV